MAASAVFSSRQRERGWKGEPAKGRRRGGGEEIVCLSFGLHDFDTQNK